MVAFPGLKQRWKNNDAEVRRKVREIEAIDNALEEHLKARGKLMDQLMVNLILIINSTQCL